MLDFAEWLASKGFDHSTLTADQKTALSAAWRATEGDAQGGGDDPLLAKYLRQAPDAADAIRAAHANATAAGGDPRAVELAMLRATRAQPRGGFAPYVPDRGAQASSGDILAAGLCSGLGMPLSSIGKLFGAHVADRVSHRDLRGLTLHGLARMRLQEAGTAAPPGRLGEGPLREAFAAVGPSMISVSDILANVGNKFALESFSAVPVAWSKFCREGSLPDFKPSKLIRLTGGGQYQTVAPGGEVQHMTMSEDAASNQLDTKGALLALDRRDIINDDLGMLMGTPKILGRQGALAVEREVFTTLLANSGSFFGSGNANQVTTGSVLSIAGLNVTYQKMTQQLDANGDPVMIAPKVLLVPPALEITARQLTRDTTVVGTAGTAQPDSNPFGGMFEPVVSPYLAESTALHANASDAAYYLLASPGDYAIMEVAFLDGMSSPTIVSEDMDINRLGIVFRGIHDFGVAFLEPRGGVMATGAA